MKGKLYGIGVGPGDSELMTVKAARIVGEADIIITPKTEKKDGSVALDIASPYIQEHTEIVPVVFPMVLDDSTQEEGWQEAKRIILSYLDEGKSVVFLTLGDAARPQAAPLPVPLLPVWHLLPLPAII